MARYHARRFDQLNSFVFKLFLKVTFTKKLFYLLSSDQKKKVVILCIFMFIGMLFEMAGLGILLPIMSLMLNPDIGSTYPSIRPFLNFLGNPTQERLVLYGLIILIGFYLIKLVFLGFLSWRQSKFAAELSGELSKKLFKGYLLQPYSFHLQRNSAELIRNIQTEINQFQLVMGAIVLLCIEFTQILGLVAVLIIAEPMGAIIVSIFMYLASILFNKLTKKRLLDWGKQRQLHAERINQHLFQGLGGAKDMKLLGREKYFLDKYEMHNTANAKISSKVGTFYLLPRLYFELLAILGLAGMIIVMILQKKDLGLLVPTLGIFAAAAFRMIPSFNRIMSSIQQVQFAKPVVNVLYDEFKNLSKSKTTSSFSSSNRLPFLEELVIQNLIYQYPDSKTFALDNINVSIRRGDSVAFIGPSGSGKSTLIDIILGLLTPPSGKILIDGKNIYENLRDWQNNIGYVPQTIYLTDDSLLKNIAFGIEDDQINHEAISRVIKAAQLDNFIAELPGGIETLVGERGVRLSGGQRQRIGIARALYHEPTVLVLDEATSALDTDTETSVMEAIDALHGEITIIIVAHRLSTLKNCDFIYTIEKGHIKQTENATSI